MIRTYRNLSVVDFPAATSATRQEICDHLNLDLEGFERLVNVKGIEVFEDGEEPEILPRDVFPDLSPAVPFPAGYKPDKIALVNIQNAVCEFTLSAVLARLPAVVENLVERRLEALGVIPTAAASPPFMLTSPKFVSGYFNAATIPEESPRDPGTAATEPEQGTKSDPEPESENGPPKGVADWVPIPADVAEPSDVKPEPTLAAETSADVAAEPAAVNTPEAFPELPPLPSGDQSRGGRRSNQRKTGG